MRISVGVCTYNGEKYIKEQLESIINQSVKPDEIIVSDDCSSDTTVAVAEEVLKNSGISYKIITDTEHRGILKNFSDCFNACTGEVVFSSDQDDVWMSDKIERFMPYFEDGCCFVYSNAVVVDSDKQLLEEDFWKCYGIDFGKLSIDEFKKLMLNSLCIAGCNMAFTKALYDAVYPIPYHFIHDGWLAICAPWYGKVGFIDIPLIMYRRHGKNVSGFKTDSGGGKPEEQSKKNGRFDLYKYTQPSEWFGQAVHYYYANKIFAERMSDSFIGKDYIRLAERCSGFYLSLTKCLPSHRARGMGILLGQLFKGNYTLFRGDIRAFCRDMLFMLLNKNKDAEFDFNQW